MEKDWSPIAKKFDKFQHYIAGEETISQIIAKLSQLKELGNVVEFGCGTGHYTKMLATNCNTILATDISEQMIEIAKTNLIEFDNISVQQTNCYSTNLAESSYDTVFMANLIHVVSQPEKALAEAYRLLKPNGKLIIVSYTTDGMTYINILKMIYRYLKVFGKPPKGGTKFGLNTLIDFVNTHRFNVDEAKLLGDKQSKAMFVIAKKSS
ncbi:class I SAM-dependent methyltransferase [Phocoenobacter atlanticus]|uniref:class I SAM-dependent methyltransferase n=1 Tax=Phocoenobacter atlanticus TaxID=3416742 RepID=UPI002751779F|nr:class I SAM-dependent methyltransferase [Pasteurella atlantica]MDP8100773.1 class I SAM-dependent methyltransferase [Pasteurella atlantica]